MQDAKDTFYLFLRSRLAAINSNRTVVVRGAVRPAVLVPENELDAEGSMPLEAFLLFWTDLATDNTEPLPLDRARCTIRYATSGTPELSGLDRGRVMDSMDGELREMLDQGMAQKQSFSGDTPVALATSVFWSLPEWGAAELKDGVLARTATVEVFALREAGE